MSFILAIDTTTNLCSAALYRDEICLSQLCDDIGKGHGEYLIGKIDRLMRQTGLDKREIERIGVNIGPGSFAGIRVGVAATRSLKMALNCEAIGVSRFEIIDRCWRQMLKPLPKNQKRDCDKTQNLGHSAEPSETKTALDSSFNAFFCEKSVSTFSKNALELKKPYKWQAHSCVILTAAQEKFYIQLFDSNGYPLAPPHQATLDEIIAKLLLEPCQDKGGGLILSGSGAIFVANQLKQQHRSDLETVLTQPEGELAALACLAGEKKLPFPLPSPLYLRAPDATLPHNQG